MHLKKKLLLILPFLFLSFTTNISALEKKSSISVAQDSRKKSSSTTNDIWRCDGVWRKQGDSHTDRGFEFPNCCGGRFDCIVDAGGEVQCKCLPDQSCR